MCAAIAATLVTAICMSLDRRQHARQTQLLASHERALAARKEQFDAREMTRQIAALDVGRARSRQSHEEYISALGGPVGAALNHPELTIAGMLQELALVCAPQGTLPHVAVDRFTEFTVLLDLPRSEPRAALAEIARCLLKHSTQYLHAVRFSHKGVLLAQLDRRAIESLSDWAKIPAADVEKLFADPEFSQPPTFVHPASNPAEQQLQEPQNLPDDVKRQKAAADLFHNAYLQASARLRFAIDQHINAFNLAGVKTAIDLDARRKLLFDAETAAAEAKRVVANPVAEYERILQQQKLDPIYIRAALRTTAQTYTNSLAPAAKLFAAVADRSRSVDEFLVTMKRHFGLWSYQPFQDRVDFEDPAAEREYTAATKQFETVSRALEASFNAWLRALEQYSEKTAGPPSE